MSAGANSGAPRRVGEVWVQRETDEVAVYNPGTGALHKLNRTAFAIWELCDGTTTIEEMAAAVSELTSISEARATEEVVNAVDVLRRLGLIDVEPLEGD